MMVETSWCPDCQTPVRNQQAMGSQVCCSPAQVSKPSYVRRWHSYIYRGEIKDRNQVLVLAAAGAVLCAEYPKLSGI